MYGQSKKNRLFNHTSTHSHTIKDIGSSIVLNDLTLRLSFLEKLKIQILSLFIVPRFTLLMEAKY